MTMDSWGDHAEMCMAQGDITLRHNAVQSILWEEANAAGLSAEMEKFGLLPQRPPGEKDNSSSAEPEPPDPGGAGAIGAGAQRTFTCRGEWEVGAGAGRWLSTWASRAE